MGLRMPDDLVARAGMLARGGPWDPPEPVDATTVVLLRDTAAGPEVLLMRRPATMAFAPGMFVFPGGRVDPGQDRLPHVEGELRIGPSTDPPRARALTVAGVRETFEEAGVLLAVDTSGRHVPPDQSWDADRRASEVTGAFPAVLARRRLTIHSEHLVPIAHWVTPEVESRRFDTRFLAARLPEGQVVHPHQSETESAHWITPDEALDTHDRGGLPMLAPTVAVLAQLAEHRSVAEALRSAAASTVVPLMPRARLSGDDLDWVIVNAYTGQVLATGAAAPPASEERGVG